MGTYNPGTSIGPNWADAEKYQEAKAMGLNPSYDARGTLQVQPLFVLRIYNGWGLSGIIWYPRDFHLSPLNPLGMDASPWGGKRMMGLIPNSVRGLIY